MTINGKISVSPPEQTEYVKLYLNLPIVLWMFYVQEDYINRTLIFVDAPK